MKYLAIILLALAASTSTCNKQGSRTDLGNRKAATFLLGRKTDTIRWQLTQIYDPYDGGKTIIRDSLNPEYLIVGKDGAFKEYDNENHSEGRWFINKDKTRMALLYEVQNGMTVEADSGKKAREMPEELRYRYEIREISREKLVLAIQGRHGMVEKTYVTADTSREFMPTDTLPAEPPAQKE